MQITALVSGKGGVGRTTLVANLAVSLALQGKRVLAIDLDPQNSLGVHLGLGTEEIAGHSREGIGEHALFASPYGVDFIPFGVISSKELHAYQGELHNNPFWLTNALQALGSLGFDHVLLDTPAGHGVFTSQGLVASQFAVLVSLADAVSYSTIPSTLSLLRGITEKNPDFQGLRILLNQLPHHNVLGQEVWDSLMNQYGKLVMPIAIHRSPRVAESLAYERPVIQYDPECEASLEICHVGEWLSSHIEH